MSQATGQRAMVSTIMSAFASAGMADTCTFNPVVGDTVDNCTIQVDRTLVDAGFETRLPSGQVRVTAQIAEVGTPRQGDIFTIGASSYRVEKPLESDDESTVSVLCRVIS